MKSSLSASLVSAAIGRTVVLLNSRTFVPSFTDNNFRDFFGYFKWGFLSFLLFSVNYDLVLGFD